MNIIELQAQIHEYDRTHRIELYDPYPFQKKFHAEPGFETDRVAEQVGLLSANQIGKTTAGGSEAAYHGLAEYPDWWEGMTFRKPVTILCAGVSNDSTKRIIQRELLGGMIDTPDWGTGSIPKHRLGKPTRKAGVPDAYESFTIKGKYGDSTVWLMAYEQGWQKFQGIRFDYAWLDEEPPLDILSQVLRGTISREQSRISITMTPEEGVTEVVNGFLNDLKKGQAVVTATWEEAKHADDTDKHKVGDTHLTEEKKEQILAALPAHQREMRSKGIPFMGSGLVFPVRDEDIMIDPVPIQAHWAQVVGIDFGVDHPFGASRLCWDKDADIVYVANEYRESGKTPPIHAEHIRHWGDWIPIMWPHDGIIRDKGSGIPLAEQYRRLGLKMHYEKFSNPPAIGQKEGQGGQGVEVGLMEMLTRMESGRFKVFSTCTGWLEEKRMYHRKNGAIVKLRDDLISASRYAHQMLRFAQTQNYQYGGPLVYKDERAIV